MLRMKFFVRVVLNLSDASDDAVLLITDNATGVGKAFGDGADDLIAAISYPSLLKHG